MTKINSQFVTVIFILIFLTGCNVTKHLNNNEQLYTGGEVKINNSGKVPEKSLIKEELEALVPKGNTKFLGMRPKLWVYYNVDPGDKTKGLKATIRKKLGEPPVLIQDINAESVERRMVNVLNNRGHFQAMVNSTEEGKGKKISLEFVASIKSPYTINEIFYPDSKSTLDSQLRTFQEKTLLKPGKPYRLDKLEEERERIDAGLKELGYFYFNPEYLIFKVDSTVGDRKINVHLEVKPDVPQKGLVQYKINKVSLNPDYEIADTIREETNVIRVDSIDFVKKGNGLFRPKSLTRIVFIKEDSLYSRKDHNITLNRLMGLDVFKYVNIRFREARQESDSTGEGLLNARIQMSPLLKKSLRAEVQGFTKSTNFSGSGIQFSFKNRNAFRGAELLIFNLNTSFETQFSGQYKNLFSYELQPQVQLLLPRFLTPFNISPKNTLFVPRTKVEVSYRLQNIIARYSQNSFNGSFGYVWKESIAREHEFNPINVSYITFGIKDSFQTSLDKIPSLAFNFQDQVILGSTYSYTWNDLLEGANSGKNHFYFNGNIDVSGNLMNLAERIAPAIFPSLKYDNGEPTGKGKFGGKRFNQYSRVDVDFRYYHDLSNSERIATRFFLGVGYPYGNSEVMPIIKQYFSGGPTSLRGFRARTIGPGLFRDPDFESAFFTQLGDMRVEGNIEYRFDLISIVKGALFIDAGNVWLTRKYKDDLISEENVTDQFQRKGDQVFKMNKLWDELAISGGFGLRFDVSFLVLRLDLGIPLRKFYFHNKFTGEEELRHGSDRWAFNEISFFDPMWRKRNLVLNIAIGYPF